MVNTWYNSELMQMVMLLPGALSTEFKGATVTIIMIIGIQIGVGCLTE
jgi:hypothetical protein